MNKIILKLTDSQRELVPSGPQAAVFADFILKEPGAAEKKKSAALVVVLEMAATNRAGKRFTVSKEFSWTTKGQAEFRRFYGSWSGKSLSPDQLEGFEIESELLGKPLMVEIAYKVEDGKTVARVEAFLPAGETKIAVSPDFIREEAKTSLVAIKDVKEVGPATPELATEKAEA